MVVHSTPVRSSPARLAGSSAPACRCLREAAGTLEADLAWAWLNIVRDGGRWSSRTGGPRTQAPACCHAHRDPAGCASSIRSSCPGSVAAGAGHPPPALPRPGAGALGARPPRRPGSAGDHRPATADAEASRCLPVLWPARSTGSLPAAPTGARPGSWPQDPRSPHAAWPGSESLPHRALRDLRPSDPGSAAIRSGRADAARATARHPALRASAPTALHGSVAGAAAPALTASGRSRPRTRPCCVLTPDRRGWHSRGCRRAGPGEDVPAGQNQAGPLHV